MRVAELMRTDVRAIAPDATITEAVEMLADAHVSGLPVVDHHGRFVGVLTSTDILQAEAEAGDAAAREELFDGLVEELMTRTPRTVSEDTDAREAAQQMLYLDIHRLFVVRDGRVVGVVSQSDLVRAMAQARV
jgi:CBS domain-containing protein